MQIAPQFWRRAWKQFSAPKVSDAELDAYLTEARQKLPTPVFWLLGKTQSGKTSIIRALTGDTSAQIGTGLRPCTRTAREYAFPSESECLLRFLDTRGLGEVDYDPAEDLALFSHQAHLLIVVMKAMDHAQQAVLAALQQIHEARPEWPVLVVQTALHEGYASPQDEHLQPYPFDQSPFPMSVPTGLARSLLSQREAFNSTGIPMRYVAVDLTQPEDGYAPVHYGLEALWGEIEAALPMGLRGMLTRTSEAHQNLSNLHYRTAHPHILSYAVVAGAAAAIPVPLLDVPLVLAVQAKMFQALASIYHQEMDRRRMREVLGALGVGYLGLTFRELLKIIPVLGSAVASLYAGAATYALGVTLCVYFDRLREGAVPNPAEFRVIYERHFREGRERLRSYLDNLRRQEPPAP